MKLPTKSISHSQNVRMTFRGCGYEGDLRAFVLRHLLHIVALKIKFRANSGKPKCRHQGRRKSAMCNNEVEFDLKV